MLLVPCLGSQACFGMNCNLWTTPSNYLLWRIGVGAPNVRRLQHSCCHYKHWGSKPYKTEALPAELTALLTKCVKFPYFPLKILKEIAPQQTTHHKNTTTTQKNTTTPTSICGRRDVPYEMIANNKYMFLWNSQPNPINCKVEEQVMMTPIPMAILFAPQFGDPSAEKAFWFPDASTTFKNLAGLEQ